MTGSRLAALFTLLSLACLVLVLLPGPFISALCQYRIDLTAFKAAVASNTFLVPPAGVDNLLFALRASATAGLLADRYDVFLWNFCSTPGNCSSPQPGFAFDPVAAFSLDATLDARHTPANLLDPLVQFNAVIHWLLAAYLAAAGLSVLAFLSYMPSLRSRFATTIASILVYGSVLLTLAAAITSTVTFNLLVNAWFATLLPYMVTVSRGIPATALDWTSVALSAMAAIFHLRARRVSRRRASGYTAAAATTAASSDGLRQFTLSRGYQQIDDQEKNLLPGPDEPGARPTAIELQNTTYAGVDRSAALGREAVYEPFRPAAI